ncbi:MAG: hypothetical protein V3S44_09785 [Alphaproteobacteria bacterium]
MRNSAGQLHELARQALALLRAQGVTGRDGAIKARVSCAAGATLEISCRGPDLPGAVPGPCASYQMIADQPAGWRGAYRLVVRAPLVVFDLCWNADEPLRIMGFSRGDWEGELMAALP